MKKQVILRKQLSAKFEIAKYCRNEPRFNGDYSRNNLPQMKDMGCNKS